VIFLSSSVHSSPEIIVTDHVSDEGKKGSPHSIAECRVPELIPVLGSQPAGDM